ncbi:hypothetical protein HC028_16560 [Planosporangium flavigriseum]|uniref:Right handed beta helix domain-containing protein n=1 Tax=Planosporangium flavigriseum TaxID=373681 RepID=A0A8J3LTC2_9ACTN|nr:right-handed parallel beta-helix repeat-containing protein [Planosporangium flavigriseum]NJC66104.1 hypothetical protein [Planosporangium flavigriseum]GIG76243.1 hypothetical protein Pfl04_46470 [Planosporangium flavigriseum]
MSRSARYRQTALGLGARHSRTLRLTVAAVAATVVVGGIGAGVALATPAPAITANGRSLQGATVGTTFTADVTGASSNLTQAKFILDGVYLGTDESAPFSWPITTTSGSHTLKVRAEGSTGAQVRLEATFTVKTGTVQPAPGSPASPSPNRTAKPVPPQADTPATTDPAGPAPTATAAPVPSATATTPPAGSARVWSVSTVDGIRQALANAKPGDVVNVADGEYTFKPRLVASASGTKNAPITLRGSRKAVLRTKNTSGDYGLWITGSYWRVEGLTVAHASKGIVLDRSVGTVIDGVEVYDIGAEAVHFRTCSTDGVLRNSFIHDTGVESPQYGEGVYVGSANSNWSSYKCTDPVSGQTVGDNSERVTIENNLFRDITAEGADLKEGTDSGVLRNNRFEHTGFSGANSADSAVDAKGNNWLIQGNVVTDNIRPWVKDGVARANAFLDAFQTHAVYAGYGTGNVFTGNVVEGAVSGFGIAMYPALANVARCDNSAPRAALGLVGNQRKPVACVR